MLFNLLFNSAASASSCACARAHAHARTCACACACACTCAWLHLTHASLKPPSNPLHPPPRPLATLQSVDLEAEQKDEQKEQERQRQASAASSPEATSTWSESDDESALVTGWIGKEVGLRGMGTPAGWQPAYLSKHVLLAGLCWARSSNSMQLDAARLP